MSAGAGSVRKRCAMFDCSNAVFTTAPECARCARVVAGIENFRRKSLDDLKAAIDKENASLTAQTPVARAASAPATMRPSSSKSSSAAGERNHTAAGERNHSATTGLFGRPVAVADQHMPSGATQKIVRIPDEVPKLTDREIAKKRTQTPGRPRTTQSQDE